MTRSRATTATVCLLALFTQPARGLDATTGLFTWQRAIAGMSAYCAATVISSPVDVVKCRMQLKKSSVSTLPLMLSMFRDEGPLVFFAGLRPALLMAPAAVVQYCTIDPLRSVMPLFAAAIIAGTLDILIKCPFERIKTQLQAGEKLSVSELLRRTYNANGVRGLYAGLGATLARDVPYLVLKWITYARAQTLLTDLFASGAAATLLAGAIAGAVAATAVTPADVLKTRMQVGHSRKDKAEDTEEEDDLGDTRTKVLAVGREILAESDGVLGFFAGIGPRLMRIPIYTAITLATFDFIKDMFLNAHVAA